MACSRDDAKNSRQFSWRFLANPYTKGWKKWQAGLVDAAVTEWIARARRPQLTLARPEPDDNPDPEQFFMLRTLLAELLRPRRAARNSSRGRVPTRTLACEHLEQRTLLTANAVVGASIDTGQISGSLWNDVDGDGIREQNDLGLAGWTVFLDSNRDGTRDDGEPTATTDALGTYQFLSVSEGDYVVSTELPISWNVSTDHQAIRGGPQQASLARAGEVPSPAGLTGAVPINTVPTDTVPAKHAADQLIVQFTEEALDDPLLMQTLRDVQAQRGHITLESTPGGIELWQVGPHLSEARASWSADPRLLMVEPNYQLTLAETVPDDERYDQMWALDNTGQTGGKIDADIDAPEAWDLQTGSGEIVIGVIDSGIDYNHPDLANNIWINPGEIAGNGIDDDGNGYVDDIHGWDFASGDSDPMDGNGHGTHVAGTIAATGNNAEGVVGVNWNAKLMALRFLNNSGSGSIYNALAALEYATMMGADITNNSWIGDPYTPALQTAISRAEAAGSLYVVCAGNNSNDNDSNPEYPASYLGSNVISVAATNHNDALAPYSNYGATSVHVAAPGSSILSTKPGGGYTTKSGTSMASPHVAGVASLLLSKRSDLTPGDVRQAIMQGTDQLSNLEDKILSGGRLNAYGALMEVAPHNGQFVSVQATSTTEATFGLRTASDQSHQFVQIIDNGDTGFTHAGFNYQSNSQVSDAYAGNNHTLRGGDGTAHWTFDQLPHGQYTVSATWFHKYNNAYNSIDAPFTLTNESGVTLDEVFVNQRESPSEFTYGDATWNTLSTVDVIDGQLIVSLTAGSNTSQYAVADAIHVSGAIASQLSLSLSADSTSESGTDVALTVARTGTAGDLTVLFSSSDQQRLSVPTSVVIPDGESEITVSLTPLDNQIADGAATVTITAGAEGYATTTASLEIIDNDASFVAIIDNGEENFSSDGFTYRNNSQVSGAYQGDNHSMRGGDGTATWSFTHLPAGEYTIAATWLHVYENAYNTTDAPFTVTGGNNELLSSVTVDQSSNPQGLVDAGATWQTLSSVQVTDGILTVRLGAGSNANRYSVADAIRIENTSPLNRTLDLTINSDSFSESAGPSAAVVTISRTDTSGDLTVLLESDDTSEATVPGSIVIPDGSTSASFQVAAQDDNLTDGTQTVTILASATGYDTAQTTILVTDDDTRVATIIDNSDAAFTSTGFMYQENAQVAPAYQGDNHTLRGNSGIATWAVTGLENGEYNVAATWFHKYENVYNATDAPFSIHNASGELLSAVTVDQSNSPDGFTYDGAVWQPLTTVTVTDGVLKINLTGGSNNNRYSVADAILIERIADSAGTADAIFRNYGANYGA